MVDFVGVLSLLALLLVRFILQDLDAFPSARLVLAGFSHRVQLTYLILREKGGEREDRDPGMNAQTKCHRLPGRAESAPACQSSRRQIGLIKTGLTSSTETGNTTRLEGERTNDRLIQRPESRFTFGLQQILVKYGKDSCDMQSRTGQ